ncbi:MAG: carboxypeptidase regulatory-like domain-containing protein [Bacteroidetes bacterium]|nr:carboxypeptidase regulatory-like domain-containing protein [Bacteroidota bacterium]
MKRITLILSLLFISLITFGQNFYIFGTVVDSNGHTISGIHIEINGVIVQHHNNVISDHNGEFADTIHGVGTQAGFDFTFIDCFGDTVTHRQFINLHDTTMHVTLDYCPAGGGGGGGALSSFSISGYVVLSNGFADKAMVYLIEFDNHAGTLTAIDSVQTVQGFFIFHNVPQGHYFVKAWLLTSSTFFHAYLPTYYGDVLFWYHATLINGHNVLHSPVNIGNIHLKHGHNTGGPGFIGGSIHHGANKSGDVGDPIVGASVILLNEDDSAVTHTVTNTDGEYSFDTLGLQGYKVIVEIMGLESEILVLDLTSADPSYTIADFEVTTTGVFIAEHSTAVIEPITGEISIAPNPAMQYVTISMKDIKRDISINIFDLQGRSVMFESVSNTRIAGLDVSKLADGLYIIEVRTDDSISRNKLLKTH